MNITRDDLLNMLEENNDLPPFPDILLKLVDRINDPECDVHEIAGLIDTDPILSGKLIKLANSALFGRGLGNGPQGPYAAIMRLGLTMVLDLAYTVQMPSTFSAPKSFAQISFWEHSLSVAYLTSAMVQEVEVSREDEDAAYLTGLMHDVGILVFDFLIPLEYKKFVDSIRTSKRSLEVLEQETFGIDHARLGADFIQKAWPVAPEVRESIRAHHDPIFLNGQSFTLANVVSVADQLVYTAGISHGIETEHETHFEVEQQQFLGLSLETLENLITQSKESLKATEQLLRV